MIADSRGVLEGLMHVFRRSEYAKDVIVLVSEKRLLRVISITLKKETTIISKPAQTA